LAIQKPSISIFVERIGLLPSGRLARLAAFGSLPTPDPTLFPPLDQKNILKTGAHKWQDTVPSAA
jgi:hypothetical protein